MAGELAVIGTRRTMKELVDGTIRVQIDIDPQCREDFLRNFAMIDAPVALVRVIPGKAPMEPVEAKGGALAKLAGMWCESEDFRAWFWSQVWTTPDGASILGAACDEDETAQAMRLFCGVGSRADLDHDRRAAELFNEYIRLPWMKAQGVRR